MVLTELAASAGTALVQAMVTDSWEGVRHKVARLFGLGGPDPAIERRLDATRQQLAATPAAELPQAEALLTVQWQTRFDDLLADYPAAHDELAALVKELQPITSSAQHSVVAAGDVKVEADRGSVAAAVIHGDVQLPDPPGPDLAHG